MSDKYIIADKFAAHYITMTIVEWVDVFSRNNQKLAIIDSLKHCIDNKGLTIFAYVVMPNHVHLICRADGEMGLSEIIRDFKTHTSKKIIKLIKEEPESRREWMLEVFSKACSHLKRNQKYKVWQSGNQAKEIFSSAFFYEKLEYIHNNPVVELMVSNPEDYMFSSARNYADLESYLKIELADHKPIIKNWK